MPSGTSRIAGSTSANGTPPLERWRSRCRKGSWTRPSPPTCLHAALHQSLDLSKVVRTLLVGLRDALGDHERVTEWTLATAERVIREGRLPSFITAMRVLVGLRDFDGPVPLPWRLALFRASKDPELAPRVLLFAREYERRFPSESWWWVREARRRSIVALLRRHVTVEETREARES